MSCRGCSRKPKKIPYGSKRKRHWCLCDRNLINPISKRSERQKAKKNINKLRNEE